MVVLDRTLLRNARFRLLWTGQTISTIGSQFSALAFPVLAVTLLGATEWQMGTLNAAEQLAFLVVGLPAGAWVDRWRKRKVLINADIVRMLMVGVVPVLWYFDLLQMWHLYVTGTIIGIATVFFDVAYQSYLPNIVEHELLGPANSALETTNQFSRVGGPAFVGVLIDIVSAPVLMVADAFSFLGSALTLRAISDNEQPTPKHERRSLRIEIEEGLRFVAGQPVIRRIATNTALTNFSFSAVGALMPLFVLRDIGATPSMYGVVMSISSIGGLLGALAATPLQRKLGEGPLVILSAAVGSAANLLIPVAAYVPRFQALALIAVSDFIFVFTVLTYNITQVSARQRLCPPELLGRMNASIRFFIWGVMPLGSLAGGALGTALGIVPTLWLGCFGTVAAAMVLVLSPLWKMRYIAPPA